MPKIKVCEVFKGTCGQPSDSSSEEEIASPLEELSEEIEEELPEEEKPCLDEVDAEAMYDELECMYRQIEVLQLALKKEMQDPSKVQVTCTPNPEVCELQKQQHKMQQQINKTTSSFKYIKEEIRDLREQMCLRSRDIEDLQRRVCLLNYWRDELAPQFNFCNERYEYLERVKADKNCIEECFVKEAEALEAIKELFRTENCCVLAAKELEQLLKDVQETFPELNAMMEKRFKCLEMRIDAVEQSLL